MPPPRSCAGCAGSRSGPPAAGRCASCASCSSQQRPSGRRRTTRWRTGDDPPQKKNNFFFADLFSAERRKRVRRELRVRALLLALPLLRHLPPALGAALGTLAWYLTPRQRRLACEHLALAFPEKTQGERHIIGRRSFANLGRAMLAAARGDAGTAALAPEDEALLRAAQPEGKGGRLVTGHLDH